ncbi:apolipophorin-III-like protein [Calliopsis andreniformis]|uniref:apolipophorin-III-like protein n=1 Tax=Calliopsis andreniformis TaxID=337506 RepID=UPI003FCEC178
MKSILTIVLAVAVLSDAKVARETTAANSQESLQVQLNELISQAQSNINNMAKQIQEQLNLPDQETIVRTVKEQSNNFVANIQSYMQNMTEEVKTKQPELEAMWNDIKVKLNKAVDDISSGIPNAQQQVADLQAKFQQGVQVILKESDTAAKSLSEHSGKIQEDLAKLTKQAVDIAVQATQNLNTNLQQAAAAGTAAKN